MSAYVRQPLSLFAAVGVTFALFRLIQLLLPDAGSAIPELPKIEPPQVTAYGAAVTAKASDQREPSALPSVNPSSDPDAFAAPDVPNFMADEEQNVLPGSLETLVAKGPGLVDGASPIVRIEPSYPRQAAKNGVEGWVLVRFAVTAKGFTDNVKAVAAEPAGVFDAAAVAAVAQWRYAPRFAGESPLRTEGVEVKLVFRLVELEEVTGY